MKVKEVIEELSKVNPDKEVQIVVYDNDHKRPTIIAEIDYLLNEVYKERAEYPVFIRCSQ